MRRFLLVSIVLFGLFPVPGWADDVFISNRPFKGQIYGVGNEIRFGLADLARALDLRSDETPEGWFLGGKRVEVSREHGTVWIAMDDLPAEIVRVVRNKAFGTVDLYKVSGDSAAASPGVAWGGEGSLVVFGASWCPTTAAMRTTISEIEQSRLVRVVHVDVEAKESPSYKENAHLFEGNKIPYFVLLDDEGRKLHSAVGFHSYPEMLAMLQKHLPVAP